MRAADHRIIARIALDDRACDRIGQFRGIDQIVAITAKDLIFGTRRGKAVAPDRLIARAAKQLVAVYPAAQQIIARAAKQPVLARKPALDRIACHAAKQGVMPKSAVQQSAEGDGHAFGGI